MKLQRYDRSLINDYAETPEGYLTVRVPITRPGVFPYQRTDGTVQMEAKLPDEIFSDLTIRSARSKPITDNHPNEPVTLDNYNVYAKGMSHTDVQVEDLKLYVSLTITDKALINKIHEGKREISIGFMSDIVAETGAYNGQNYDYVQRNIEINHIAIVEQGRAGSEVAIRSDSDAWQIDADEKGGTTLVKYKINGVEYDIDPKVKAHIESLAASTSTDEDPEEEETEPEKKEEPKKKKTDAADALQARCDMLTVSNHNLKSENERLKQSQVSQDALDKQVEERVALITSAKQYLGDSFDFVGKTDRAIKEAVVAAVMPSFKADDKSDEYVNVAFDMAVEQVTTQGFSSTGANSIITGDASQSTDINAMQAQRLNMRV